MKAFLAIVLSVLLLLGSWARAGQVENPQVGYTLWVPDDWAQIPQEMVQKLQATVRPAAADWNYCAAYEPTSHTSHFQYPYIIVQETPYPGRRHITTVAESELKELTRAISGLSDADVKQNINASAADLVGDIGSMGASYFTNPPGFRVAFTATVAGGVQLRGSSHALIGRDRAVLVHFYAPQADWNQHQPLCSRIAQSLRLSPNQQVTLGGASGGGSDWSRVWSGAFVGGIIGGIVGGIVAIVKKRRAKP